jgi:hypothetical protein
MEQNDEIAALKSQVAALKARLDERDAEDSRKSIVRPPVEQQTKVIYPVTVSPIAQPSDGEFRRLKEICSKTYPMWCDSKGFVFGLARYPDHEACDAEWFSQFKLAFLAISNMRRLDRPDPKRYVTAHIDMCAAFLARVGKWSELRVSPFMMACFCAGDVPIAGMGIDGQSISVGLAEHTGKLANADAWLTVLSSGRLPNQVEVRLPMAPASPSRVIVDDRAGW